MKAKSNPWDHRDTSDHRFPCGTCGSDLRFDPTTGTLKCGHCGNEDPIPAQYRGIDELNLRTVENEKDPDVYMEETRVSRCESCGAQVEFDADIHASECPFCASPIVSGTGAHRHIKPQAQIAFHLTDGDATSAMRSWIGRLWFAPSDLRKIVKSGQGMNGIYVPYWTYDAETRSRYRGQRGTIYYESRRVPVVTNGKRRMATQRVAKIRWRPASGQVSRNFDDVIVLASTSLPKRFTDALAPWDLSELTRYEPRYLAGFRAEGYGRTVKECYNEARDIMNNVIWNDVRQDIGGDQQRVSSLDTDVGELTFKHVLLPVWMAAYKYRGKTYRFVVNGQSGAVEGERPYSPYKIGLAILAGILIALSLAFLQINQG